MEGSAVVLGFVPSTIYLAAWIVAVVFAVRMVRNSGGKPERFLLIGACLMLASSVIHSAAAGLNPWLMPKLMEDGVDLVSIAQVFSAIAIVRGCISLAGIVFLVYAFWKKFKAKPTLT